MPRSGVVPREGRRRGTYRREDWGVPPATHYVESDGVHIAYQVVGEGSRDILFVPGLMSHVELAWEDPSTVAFNQRLATLGRLILFDKRDTGLSDSSPRDSPLEERMQDLHAVMADVDCETAVVVGYSEGAPMSILFRCDPSGDGQRIDPGLRLRPLDASSRLSVRSWRRAGIRGHARYRNAPLGRGSHH